MNFQKFAQQVRGAGLSPRDCGNNHWQIRGGKFCVNFYPTGPSYYINGMNSGSRHKITLADAIIAANSPQINKLHRRTRQRKSSYKGIRRRLLKQNPLCYWCKKQLTASSATVDHVIPLSKGGTNGFDNFVLACKACNTDRRNALPKRTEWEKFLQNLS